MTGTTSNNLEPVDACSSEGSLLINKFSALTSVTFIIVGIVVEAITNHATIDEEKWCKPARADLYDTL